MTATKKIAVIALMAATLSGGKTALSFVPNVEIVTVLIALYAYVFGMSYVFPCVLVFVTAEIFIWGLNTWVVSYYIYWPTVAFVFSVLGKRQAKLFSVTLSAVILTLFFGVLTSLIDVGLLTGSFDNFWYRFAVMYARGIVFFAVHVFSNLIVFLALFNPLEKTLEKLKKQLENKNAVL